MRNNNIKKLCFAFIIVVITLFIDNIDVNAKKFNTDYTCTYNFTLPETFPGGGQVFTFSVDVDLNSGKTKENIDNNKFREMTNYVYSITPDTSFRKKFSDLAQNSEIGCPDVSASQEGENVIFKIGNAANSATENYNITGKCSGNCDAVKKERIDYCTRNKPSRNNDFYWYISFYTIDGKKMYSVRSSDSSATVEAEAGQGVGIGGTSIKLDSALLDKMYNSKNECANVEIYLDCPAEDNITITSTKPNALNNCSYVDADEDNGKDATKTEVETDPYKDNDLKNGGDCDSIIGDNVMKDLKKIFGWIRILVPIFIIILGSVDFGKAVISDDQKALNKAVSTLIKRLIAAVALFFAPIIIMYLISFVDKLAGGCDIRDVIK